jgi:exonuclease III
MRVVSWNCKGATKENKIWNYLQELSPDILLLQEVTSFPLWIEENYSFNYEKSITKNNNEQRFGNLLAYKGDYLKDVDLPTELTWVNNEIKKFKGNMLTSVIKYKDYILKLVCLYSSAWPLNKSLLEENNVKLVKLTQSKNLWFADLLWYTLKCNIKPNDYYIVGGDYNLSITFDSWQKKPRGNQEYLDRMKNIGFIECLREYSGCLVPTFKNASNGKIIHQMDHLFVTQNLHKQLNNCYVSDEDVIFKNQLSDHLPIIADFDLDRTILFSK